MPGGQPVVAREANNNLDLESLMLALGTERVNQLDRQIQQTIEAIRARNEEIKLRLMTRGLSSQGAEAVLQGGGTLSQADAMAAERALSTDKVAVEADQLNSANELEMAKLQNLMSKRNQMFDVLSNILHKYASTSQSVIGNMR